MLGAALTDQLRVVVLTKPARPGHVKTRLALSGPDAVTPQQAAAIHAAMVRCVADRLAQLSDQPCLMAIDGGRLDAPDALPVALPGTIQTVDQGTGNLEERLNHLWRGLGDGPVVFFGTDSPDLPQEHLEAVAAALQDADAAVGPVDDGGYWCLAGVRYLPELLHGIDWGTPSVYHQTLQAARRADVRVAPLPAWHDVDTPADLAALRRRLTDATEPALQRLAQDLQAVRET